jgi:pyrroline-5-carboxylate reductase
MKILFVGGGNMAQAILGGLIAQDFRPENISVVEPVATTRQAIEALGITAHASIRNELINCDAIVLAVKPQMMSPAISPLAGKLRSQVVISIAAGIGTASLGRWLGTNTAPYANVIRTMPNTPALIRAGISGLYAASGVNEGGRQIAESLLGAVGKTVWFDTEAMLDAVTAVSGSGPAYVFYFIEALEEAALQLGFDPEAARMFAVETFVGSAALVASTNEAPGVLRARVTSRRGTTERAIETFDAHALRQGFIEGVNAAATRSRELGEELSAATIDNSGARH